ncbi:MAG: hypothetical protein ABIP39_10800 [Polyangiaceae bacterium]
MKLRPIGLIFVAGGIALSLSAIAAPPAKPPTKPAQADAPMVPSLATLLEGFKWGTNRAEVTKLHNQAGGIFDREYNSILVKMQPGVRMTAIESERDSKKTSFANSFIEFKETPVGFDTTLLKGEYTYRNHEAVQVVEREGKRRFFFYVGAPPAERMWKIYDEVGLRENGPAGKTYEEAVLKMNSAVGVAGKAHAPDPEKGWNSPFTEWQDATSHLRVVDRSAERIVGIVLEDKAVMNAMSTLRSNKAEDPLAMDPSIAAITKGGISDPNGVRAAGDAGAPKPKKK